jgi:hypothetical protein
MLALVEEAMKRMDEPRIYRKKDEKLWRKKRREIR